MARALGRHVPDLPIRVLHAGTVHQDSMDRGRRVPDRLDPMGLAPDRREADHPDRGHHVRDRRAPDHRALAHHALDRLGEARVPDRRVRAGK
jgi:hypothetical protein